MERTSKALDEAADLIERDGWYSMYHGATPYGSKNAQCASNAIAKKTERIEPQYALAVYVSGERNLSAIWNWNDHPDRTAAEVIEVLRACAVIEQAREEQDAAWATYAGLVTA